MKDSIKNVFKSSKEKLDSEQRITNAKVEQFRKGVIKKGKKFKYPIQYEKHRIIINASIVALLGAVIATAVAWWGLYKLNSDSSVLFKLTQIIPLSVGEVDGQEILFSDYLAQYRSSMHYQSKQSTVRTEDSVLQLQKEYRQRAFENATAVALARKIALEQGIAVTTEELEADLQAKLSFDNSKLSLETFDGIMLENYGLSRQEYQNLFINNPLLVRKVSFAVDTEAKDLAEKLKAELTSENFQSLVADYGEKVVFTESDAVRHNNNDGGRSKTALTLSPGQISDVFASSGSEGYYFVKLLSKNDSTLRYQSILVPLKEFNKRLADLRENDKVTCFANIDLTPIDQE